jgi:hypothetical protein
MHVLSFSFKLHINVDFDTCALHIIQTFLVTNIADQNYNHFITFIIGTIVLTIGFGY